MTYFPTAKVRALLSLLAVGIVAAFGLGCSPRSDPRVFVTDLATQTPLATESPGLITTTSPASVEQILSDRFAFEYKDLVKFAQWDDSGLEFENFIAGYIIVQGYVVDYEPVEVEADGYRSALETGEVEVVLEMSRSSSPEWYKRVTESGAVLDVGSLFGEDSDLRIGVHAGLKERAPAIVELLGKMSPGQETLDGLKARITGRRTGIRPAVAALMFFKRHEDEWTQWMPRDAVDGVKEAIDEGKTNLHRKCLQAIRGYVPVYCK